MDFTNGELDIIKHCLSVEYEKCTGRIIESEIDGKVFRIDYHERQRVVLSALHKINKEIRERG